jgi:hypothetical protein
MKIYPDDFLCIEVKWSSWQSRSNTHIYTGISPDQYQLEDYQQYLANESLITQSQASLAYLRRFSQRPSTQQKVPSEACPPQARQRSFFWTLP